MKAAGSTPPVSASSILAAGAASSHGRTLALSSPQPEPTSPCPQSPQKPPLERRGDVNGYAWATGAKTGTGATINTSTVTGASNRARNVILVYSSCWEPFPETQWLRNRGGSGHLLFHCNNPPQKGVDRLQRAYKIDN